MSEDKRDVLEVLRYELNFIEQGGYGNWYSTPWGPASIFQDSLTCPNHGDPTRPHACHECLLYDFVPEQYRTECRGSAFAFATSFGRFLAAGITFLVGAGVASMHTIGTPVALTSIAFLVGLALLPLAEETKGKELPA